MRCLEIALGLPLLALGATAWSPSCKPCWCGLDSIQDLRTTQCRDTAFTSVPPFPVDTQQIQIWGGNNISSLQGGEFNGYTNLTHIELTRNHLTELPSGIFSKTDSISKLMNRVVQRELYAWKLYMPKCAGPSSVQNKTWAEAVEVQWGAGPERCPRRVDTALKELLVAEMNKSRSEVSRELRLVQQGLRQVQNATKEDVNETRSELQLVKKDLHSEFLALKEDVRTLLEQTKQGKDVANILFKKVYHSKGKGVLVLRYSVLPSPDNTSLPAP